MKEDVIAYQFAFIKYCRAQHGELLNVGMVMTTEEGEFWVYMRPNTERMKACWPGFNDEHWQAIRESWCGKLRAFLEDSDTPTVIELRDVFQLDRSALIQMSHVMSGIHPRPEARFAHLRAKHVDFD